jgi:hypothetical protein
MMQPNKLTLITPPDFFENGSRSVLLTHLTDEEMDLASKWLGSHPIPDNFNIYIYSGEANITWFLYAVARADYKYINIDCVNYITQALSGYILGKNGTYYRTDNSDLAEVYSHINNSRVDNIEQFLESILSDKTTNEPLL